MYYCLVAFCVLQFMLAWWVYNIFKIYYCRPFLHYKFDVTVYLLCVYAFYCSPVSFHVIQVWLTLDLTLCCVLVRQRRRLLGQPGRPGSHDLDVSLGLQNNKQTSVSCLSDAAAASSISQPRWAKSSYLLLVRTRPFKSHSGARKTILIASFWLKRPVIFCHLEDRGLESGGCIMHGRLIHCVSKNAPVLKQYSSKL